MTNRGISVSLICRAESIFGPNPNALTQWGDISDKPVSAIFSLIF